MAKTINFEHKGTEYTLEFTRRSIETMERQGFVISDIVDKPMLTLPALFAGAFLANHRFMKRKEIDEIYSRITEREDLLEKLAEMYNEPLEVLMQEPEEDEGNVKWGASW